MVIVCRGRDLGWEWLCPLGGLLRKPKKTKRLSQTNVWEGPRVNCCSELLVLVQSITK